MGFIHSACKFFFNLRRDEDENLKIQENTNTKLYRKSSLWHNTLNTVWLSMGYLMKVPYCEMSLKIDRKNIEIVYFTNLYSINVEMLKLFL